jgi:hypothetical protein
MDQDRINGEDEDKEEGREVHIREEGTLIIQENIEIDEGRDKDHEKKRDGHLGKMNKNIFPSPPPFIQEKVENDRHENLTDQKTIAKVSLDIDPQEAFPEIRRIQILM